jgi:hypothetical protein
VFVPDEMRDGIFCGASHRQPAQGGVVNSGRRGVLAMAKTGLNAFFQPVTPELERSIIWGVKMA